MSKRSRSGWIPSLALLALSLAPAAGRAETAPPFRGHAFLGFTGGVGAAGVDHPQLSTPHVYGPTLGLRAGYQLSPRWSASLDFTTITWPASRATALELFASGQSWLHTLQRNPKPKDFLAGGAAAKTSMLANAFGPRVDVTPFGPDGLRLGLSAGLGFFDGSLEIRVGGSGAAHVGVQKTLFNLLTVGVEGAVEAQAYPGATVLLGYGALTFEAAIYKGLPPAPPEKR